MGSALSTLDSGERPRRGRSQRIWVWSCQQVLRSGWGLTVKPGLGAPLHPPPRLAPPRPASLTQETSSSLQAFLENYSGSGKSPPTALQRLESACFLLQGPSGCCVSTSSFHPWPCGSHRCPPCRREWGWAGREVSSSLGRWSFCLASSSISRRPSSLPVLPSSVIYSLILLASTLRF